MQVQRSFLALLLSLTFAGLITQAPLLSERYFRVAAQGSSQVETGYKQLQQGLAEQAITTFTQVLRTSPTNVQAQVGLAMAQQKAGRTAKAIIEYEKTLKLDPNNRDALRELGRLYSYQEVTWTQAIDVLQNYVAMQPNDFEGRILLANVLGWKGEHKSGEQHARIALQQQPGNTDAKLILAQTLTWQGRGKEAMPLFNELLGASKLPRTARHDYALALRQNGNYNEAERLYNQLIAEQPNNQKLRAELADLINERTNAAQGRLAGPTGTYSKEQQVWLDQARALHQQGRTKDAIPIYRRVLAQRAGDTKLFLEFADILASVPEYRQEALLLLEQEFKRNPTKQIQLARAKVLSWMPERRTEALGIYREYFRQNPADEEIRQVLTQVLIWADTDPALIGLYGEMLQLDPANEALRLRLAQALLEQKNYSQAIAHLENLLRANPDNFDARLGLAGAYLGANRIEDAEAQLRLLLQLDPSNVEVLAGLAGIAAKAGDYERASQMFRRVLATDPNHKLAMVGLADSYLGLGRSLDAIPWLKKAFDQTRDEKIGYKLAEVYQKLGQYDKAMGILNEINPRANNSPEPPASRSTVPPPTYRRNEPPQPPTEPTAAAGSNTVGASNAALEMSRPRRATDATTQPLTTRQAPAVKPPVKAPQPQPQPSAAHPMPVSPSAVYALPEPTPVAGRTNLKVKPMFMQDPDDIRSRIELETAPTLTFSYFALTRSGEEAVAFSDTPDSISWDAMLTNRIRIAYDFNVGRQLRLGFDVEPTFLSTPSPEFLGTGEPLRGLRGFGKDGVGGNFRFGFQPSERVRINGRAGATLAREAVGGIDVAIQASDTLQLLAEASRDAVTESILSYAGFTPLAGGPAIGPVLSTGGGGGIAIRFDPRTDMTIRYRFDRYDADRLPDNERHLASINIGRDISDNFGNWKLTGLEYFRVGYQFTYFGFDNDQSTIVTDGGDFFGELLVRGYYSPESYLNNGARVDFAGSYKNKLDYRFAGGLGIQVSRSIASRFNQPGTTVGALLYTNLMYRFSDRLGWGVEYEFNNAGSNYSSHRIGTNVVYKF